MLAGGFLTVRDGFEGSWRFVKGFEGFEGSWLGAATYFKILQEQEAFVIRDTFDNFGILQNTTKCYKILQNTTKYYKHILGAPAGRQDPTKYYKTRQQGKARKRKEQRRRKGGGT